jgi:hypothetical protein
MFFDCVLEINYETVHYVHGKKSTHTNKLIPLEGAEIKSVYCWYLCINFAHKIVSPPASATAIDGFRSEDPVSFHEF